MSQITIEIHEGIKVLRDDKLPGGTKSIIVAQLPPGEYVYASPVYGGFQIALAECLGSDVHIFCAERKTMHPNTIAAMKAGANIHPVAHGYLSVVEKRAREFCEMYGATKIAFGGAEHRALLVERARAVIVAASPIKEIWCAIGSGTLFEAILEAAAPHKIKVYGVQVGKHYGKPAPRGGVLFEYNRPFEKPGRVTPPFPSMINYDAKAWEYCKAYSGDKSLFWNVL